MLDLLIASNVLGAEAPVVAHQDHDALNCTGPGDADALTLYPAYGVATNCYEDFVTVHLCFSFVP